MKEFAAEIRQQLSKQPNRKTFRKSRHKLLEIAVVLEVAAKVIEDYEALRLKQETPRIAT